MSAIKANIGDYVSECTNLTSVSIPDSVTKLGTTHLYNCFSLSNLVVGNSATNIGNYAFLGLHQPLPASRFPAAFPASGTGVRPHPARDQPHPNGRLLPASGPAHLFFDCPKSLFQRLPTLPMAANTSRPMAGYWGLSRMHWTGQSHACRRDPGAGHCAFCDGCTSLTNVIPPLRGSPASGILLHQPGPADDPPKQRHSVSTAAFAGNRSTSVTIPDSVTSIGRAMAATFQPDQRGYRHASAALKPAPRSA